MNLSSKIFTFVILSFNSSQPLFALSNYQIIKICQREKIEKKCIKRLRSMKIKLNQGKPIEVPVLPYK